MKKSYQPLTPFVEVEIDRRLVVAHLAAHRRLKKELGAKAPSLEELIKREFEHRSAKQLVEEFLVDQRPRETKGSIRLLQEGKPVRFD